MTASPPPLFFPSFKGGDEGGLRLRLRSPFGLRLKEMLFNGDDAGIEARSLMLDTRVSSFEKRASIRASTTINFKLNP